MKRIILSLSLACLLTAMSLLAACQTQDTATPTPTAPVITTATQPTTVAPTTPVAPTPTTPAPETNLVPDSLGNLKEKPVYGGSITIKFINNGATDFIDPIRPGAGQEMAAINNEFYQRADITLGPQGTNQFPFSSTFMADEMIVGALFESWEIIDLNTVYFNLRQGVNWSNTAPVNGRAFVADDVIFSFERMKTDSRHPWYINPAAVDAWIATEMQTNTAKMSAWQSELQTEGIDIQKYRHSYLKKIDSYKVLYRNYEDSTTLWRAFIQQIVYPREVIQRDGDLSDWRAHCTLGPWIMEDVVPGTAVTWRRNPDYWMHDPFFPENSLPYADRLRALVIADRSTFLTAMRTGRVDFAEINDLEYGQLYGTNPDLMYRQVDPPQSFYFAMRTDIPPFNDIKVPQAVMLAYNHEEVLQSYYKGNGVLMTWPVMPSSPTYTPLDELPAQPTLEGSGAGARELWGYDPAKAKQLLADAGYASGFETGLIGIAGHQLSHDMCQILVQYMAEVGIKVNYRTLGLAAYSSTVWSADYEGFIVNGQNNHGLLGPLGMNGGQPRAAWNPGKVTDATAEAVFNAQRIEFDAVAKTAMVKAEIVRQQELAYQLPMPMSATYITWTPWVKGYAGELGYNAENYPASGTRWKHMWVDQILKQQMR